MESRGNRERSRRYSRSRSPSYSSDEIAYKGYKSSHRDAMPLTETRKRDRLSSVSSDQSSFDSSSNSEDSDSNLYSKRHRSLTPPSPPTRRYYSESRSSSSRSRSASDERIVKRSSPIKRRSPKDVSSERHASSLRDIASRKHKKKSKKRKKSRELSEEASRSKKKHSSSSNTKRSAHDSDECDSDAPNRGEWILQKLKQLQDEKLKTRDEKKKLKDVCKSLETPEEKRLRRLLKKEAKERKRKERMGWDKDYMHYTNTDNPFGDANLLETFVWHKKLDKDGLTNVTAEDLENQNKLKQEENKRELEKVKKRRLEREQERAQREEEMQRLQRQKEAAQFKEWEKQEDTFHLQQALLRSKIRIEDGRAKPIDLLAKYISTEDEDLAVEMHEPYTYLNGLTIRDLEDLLEDIKVYMELEKGKNLDYWNDITIIVEEELHKLRKVDAANRELYGDRREGINTSVTKEVSNIFKFKTHDQLTALHDQIMKKITSGEEGIDIGYWESLLSQLKAQMARARLRDRHQDNLRRKLFQLKQEQGVESEPVFPCVESPQKLTVRDAYRARSPKPGPSREPYILRLPIEIEEEKTQSGTENENDTILTEDDLRDHSMEEYASGGYTPRLYRQEELEPGTLLISTQDDLKCLEFARQQLIGTGSIQTALTSEERAFEIEARKGMNDDEAMFSVEASLDHKMYLWSDKYRPRKPRYFNRVHTGFEWNKYNQTHYDMDNPPPKIVQGYKFNIFYPDLIDKGITPEYTLTPCADNKDFAILRFHAGPPYEDIAFKIVNREWEYSYKRGFRCQFQNNIFQLWFHFKRYRYRR